MILQVRFRSTARSVSRRAGPNPGSCKPKNRGEILMAQIRTAVTAAILLLMFFASAHARSAWAGEEKAAGDKAADPAKGDADTPKKDADKSASTTDVSKATTPPS